MRHARSKNSASSVAGTLAVRGIFLAAILCLVAGAGLWIAQPVTADGPLGSGTATVDDVQLTVAAREFLTRDAQLRPLNLWIVVKGRVATLSGPVPTRELGDYAEAQLRQVAGLVKVVNKLRVERPEDTAVNTFRPLPVARAGRPERQPAVADRGKDVLTVHTASPRRPAAGEDEAVLKLPPIRLTVPGPETPPVSSAKPTVPFAEDRQAQLFRSIERIRSAEARFRDVQFEVVDGMVLLKGSVARGEDQFALAQRIAQVPGVAKVVLAGIRVER